MNCRDERYLPFEGAGEIARWRVELPRDTNAFGFDTISDVVLHLRYTAREGGVMETALPEELELLRRSVRAFVEEQLVPRGEEIETSDRIPKDVIDAMAGMGLFGIGFPEAVGGQGFGRLGYCVARERLARVLQTIGRSIEEGFLPAAPQTGACGLCDYRPVCGPYEEARSKRKQPDRLGSLTAIQSPP